MMPKCPSKEDDNEITYNKYEVTLEEARNGLLKALMYLKATPSISFYHVQMLLQMVLYYFDECTAKYQEDHKQCFSEVYDNSTQSDKLGENQTSSLVNSTSDLNCINKNNNCYKEDGIKSEGISDIKGRVSVNQVTTESISDNDNYLNASALEGVQYSCENGRMGLVGKCASHLSWLTKTFPDSLAIGKSTQTSKYFGVFITKSVSSGFKWGPYKLVDVQAALFRR